MPAPVSAWHRCRLVQDERDVAVRAAARDAARAAVDRRREAAPVEQEDRLPAALRDLPELGEQRRRERVAALAAQVDDAHRRQLAGRGGRRARAARAPPSSPAAASRCRRPRPRPPAPPASPRRCARRSAGRTPACTTASCSSSTTDRARGPRTGAKTAERAPTTTRASPEAIRSRSSRRSASVSPEWSSAMRSPKRAWKRPTRLRGERDLGDEHDRPEPALERRRAGLEVDLGLAAAGRAVEQEAPAALVDRADDPLDRRLLLGRQPLGRRLAGQARRRRPPLPAPRALRRGDELERPRRRRAVVVGDPEREVDERGRQLVEHAADRRRLHPGRRRVLQPDDDAARLRARRTAPRRRRPSPPRPAPRT